MSPAPVIRIDYESEGFPVGSPVQNGHGVVNTSWDELLWAAVTVGRPNRQYVFRHGLSSMYEALFRLSLVRMALEQSGPFAYRLRRTEAAKTLDPSEKGAVNYFLGMIMCKLFSAKLLDAPWVLHLDVFRPQLNVYLTGRSRPDLVGQTRSGDWVALESKGRISPPSPGAKDKAKEQAIRLISVAGVAPYMHIGAITFFRNDVLRFFWRDPYSHDLNVRNPIKVSIDDDSAWSYYYHPILDLMLSQVENPDEMLSEPKAIRIKELDAEVMIHPLVFRYLLNRQWGDAKKSCIEHKHFLEKEAYQADGIRMVAGESWFKRFEEH